MPIQEPDGPSPRYDIVVIGAGLAGLVTANAALDRGASVLVVEKRDVAGGTVALASGHVWHSYPLRDDVAEVDPWIIGMVTRDFESAVEWLRGRGVQLTKSTSRTNGYQIVPDTRGGLLALLIDQFLAGGGKLATGLAASAIDRSADGAVEGVHLSAGHEFVRAGAVVVATGGFQGDPTLVSRYIAPAERLFWRSNPGATGDGFRMGVAAGADISEGMHSFYGHLSPHTGERPVQVDPMTYRRATLAGIEHVTMLNIAGKRFVDESRPDVAVAQALAQDDHAIGVVVFDEAVHDEWITQRNALPSDARSALVLWRAVGGRVEEADSLPELFAKLADIGFDASTALETMAAYDAAAAAGTDDVLPVPRQEHLHRHTTPPYYAVFVCPDLTFTDGGLRIDEECRALDTDGHPIPGLYVVGESAGLVSLGSQAGGIATAITTGLRAGAHASQTLSEATHH